MIFHDVAQNTDEWLDLRMGKATASKYAVIMAHEGHAFGEPAKEYALQLALERITGRRSDSQYTNEHMERGHQQEPLARMLYEEQNFVTVGNGGFFDCGEYGTSPDGLVESDGLIEIKSVIPKTHYATLKRGSHDPAYTWQMIGHLETTKRRWIDFVSFCPQFPDHATLIVHRTHCDEVLDQIDRLRERRAEFLALVRKIMQDIQENRT